MHIPSTFTRINAAWRTFMDSPVDPSGYPDIRRRPAQTVDDGPGFIRAVCRDAAYPFAFLINEIGASIGGRRSAGDGWLQRDCMTCGTAAGDRCIGWFIEYRRRPHKDRIKGLSRAKGFTPLRDRVVACEGCGGPIDPEWNCSLGSCPTCCMAGDVR